MIIKPSIRSNLFTNSHPDGCELNVLNQISEAKRKEKFEGPLFPEIIWETYKIERK